MKDFWLLFIIPCQADFSHSSVKIEPITGLIWVGARLWEVQMERRGGKAERGFKSRKQNFTAYRVLRTSVGNTFL